MCQNGIYLTIPIYYSAMPPQCILRYAVSYIVISTLNIYFSVI